MLAPWPHFEITIAKQTDTSLLSHQPRSLPGDVPV
jgi:hypothetical protein